MMVKTQEFTSIVGESYATVRNVYGRPGREPRQPGPIGEADFARGSHRRYVFADALAWRFARRISGHSLDWDTAASIVERERPADSLVKPEGAVVGQFFAIWQVTTEDRTQWASWRGRPSEIAEVIEHYVKTGEVTDVLMISCESVWEEALELARAAGYYVRDGEFVARTDDALGGK
jgi:hypothetical protein